MSRGCGDERTIGDLYLVKKIGLGGVPIWAFLLDPPVPYAGPKFRGIQLAPPEMTVGWPDDSVLLLDMVGETFYPTVPDFVAETRIYGLSRKMQSTFPVEKLEGKRVFLGLIHWNAIPEYALPFGEKRFDYAYCVQEELAHWPQCVYHLWPQVGEGSTDLRKLYSPSGKLVVEYDPYEVVTQGTREIARQAEYALTGYKPGLFMIVEITQAELVVPGTDEQKAAYVNQRNVNGNLDRLPFKVVVVDE